MVSTPRAAPPMLMAPTLREQIPSVSMRSLGIQSLLHARNAGKVHRLVVRHALRGPVGKSSANARIAHGGEFGVGVFR